MCIWELFNTYKRIKSKMVVNVDQCSFFNKDLTFVLSNNLDWNGKHVFWQWTLELSNCYSSICCLNWLLSLVGAFWSWIGVNGKLWREHKRFSVLHSYVLQLLWQVTLHSHFSHSLVVSNSFRDFLDGAHVVFGKVVEGMPVVWKINEVETVGKDRWVWNFGRNFEIDQYI